MEGRTCAQCGEAKSAEHFSWRRDGWKQRLGSRCHECRKKNHHDNPLVARRNAKAYYWKNRERRLAEDKIRRRRDPLTPMLMAARTRAKKTGLPFDIKKEDIHLPMRCPVLGMRLKMNDGKCGPNSPTLDRIVPELGYVRGNVAVISLLANTIKGNATSDQILSVANYVEANETFRAPRSGRERPAEARTA